MTAAPTRHPARQATGPVARDRLPRPGRARRRGRRRGRGGVASLLLLVAVTVVFLFPFAYMIVVSLRDHTPSGLGGLVPDDLTLRNYRDINGFVPVLPALKNSAVITGIALLCTQVFAILAGYAMAVLPFPGRRSLTLLSLVVQVVPFQVLMVPLYVLVVRSYGLGDSYLGMALPFTVNVGIVLIYRQFFRGIPREIFEAARVDGASEIRILRSVIMPVMRPALATTTILAFIGPWNDFLWPFLVSKSQQYQPLAVALQNYSSAYAGRSLNPVGSTLAGSVLLTLPSIVLFLIGQRAFTESNLGSAIKG